MILRRYSYASIVICSSIIELCQSHCLPCGFESHLVQDFQRNIMFLPSQYWDIISMLCRWARHFTTLLDSSVNEYLVGQRWQCVRLVPSAEMEASAVCSKKGVEIVHEWTGPVTRGICVKRTEHCICALYKNSPLLLSEKHSTILYFNHFA